MGGWIEFPGLGLRIENVKRSINFFGLFDIYWYAIIIAFGLMLGILLGLRHCRRYGISQDDLITYIIAAVPSAIVGARLYYVIFSWDIYKNNLAGIFNLRDGGLAIYGGIIFAVIAAIIVAKVKNQNFLRILDFAFPYIALGQAIGRWGNFVNQEAYGRTTNLPWRMTGSGIEGAVHPNFLYESLLCFFIFFFLLYFRKNRRKYNGQVVCLYLIMYGISRAFVEYIRGNDALLIGKTDLRVSLVLSLALVLCGIIFLIILKYIPSMKVIRERELELIRDAYIADGAEIPTKLKDEMVYLGVQLDDAEPEEADTESVEEAADEETGEKSENEKAVSDTADELPEAAGDVSDSADDISETAGNAEAPAEDSTNSTDEDGNKDSE